MRLRGFQIPTFNVDLGSIKLILRDLGHMGCTLARWQMVNPDLNLPLKKEIIHNGTFKNVKAHYIDWYMWELSRIKEAAKELRETYPSMYLVVDNHSPIGGVKPGAIDNRDTHRIFLNESTRHHFNKLWIETVRELGAEPSVLTWGLCNEPAAPQPKTWIRAARKVSKLIRNQETRLGLDHKTISVAIPRGGIGNIRHLRYWRKLQPLWGEIHIYHPANLTFYGVNRHSKENMQRAGFNVMSGALEEYWKPAARWREHTGGQIYVGEIGCSVHASEVYQHAFWTRWLPLLNRHEIPYTIHAFREHSAFSYEDQAIFRYIKDMINE